MIPSANVSNGTPVPSPYTKNSANPKSEPKSAINNTQTTTTQPNKSKINQAASNPKIQGNKATESEPVSRGKKEIDGYLKTISRIENKVKDGKMGDDELEVIFKALDKKMNAMTEQKQKKLLKMEFMKEHAITELDMIKDSIQDVFEDDETRNQVFDFLKSSELISLLLDKPDLSETYSPASIHANSLNGPETSSGNTKTAVDSKPTTLPESRS